MSYAHWFHGLSHDHSTRIYCRMTVLKRLVSDFFWVAHLPYKRVNQIKFWVPHIFDSQKGLCKIPRHSLAWMSPIYRFCRLGTFQTCQTIPSCHLTIMIQFWFIDFLRIKKVGFAEQICWLEKRRLSLTIWFPKAACTCSTPAANVWLLDAILRVYGTNSTNRLILWLLETISFWYQRNESVLRTV